MMKMKLKHLGQKKTLLKMRTKTMKKVRDLAFAKRNKHAARIALTDLNAEIDDDNVQDDDDAEYLEFLEAEVSCHMTLELIVCLFIISIPIQAKKISLGSDDDDELEEENLFESPLDEIDTYIRFQEVF